MKKFILLPILISGCFISWSQNDTMGINTYLQMLKDVGKIINKGDWKSASEHWEKIVAINPTEGAFWYQLGESYYFNNQQQKAIDAFKNCFRIGAFSPAMSAYYIAKCYAKTGNRSSALDWLQKSFDLGYRNIMAVQRDSNFKDYFDDARFKHIAGIPVKEFANREEGWRFDLALMAREVKRKAPNPFRYTSERKFDSTVEALRKKVASLSDIQLVVEFMKIMVLVGDGHTMIYAFFERPEFQKNLPMDFYAFDEGLFITEADKRYEELLGTRVIAFDNKTTEEIIKGVDPIVNRDNEMGPKVMGLMRMRTISLLFGLGLVKSADEVTLTVKDQEGKIKKVLVKADCPLSSRKLWDKFPENWITYHQYKKKDPALYIENKYTHYWFRYLKPDKTVYFQYNEMANDQEHPFNNFCDSLFSFIEANFVDKLIIDLRWNHGGNTLLAPYLLDKIITCKKINRRGSLYGIIGRRTYSATINLVGYLERFTPITYIGEPTGSSPNFIGEDNAIELPYSGLFVNISDQFWQSSWPGDYREWFSPLMYVPPTFKDFSQSRDPALNLVLNFKDPGNMPDPGP